MSNSINGFSQTHDILLSFPSCSHIFWVPPLQLMQPKTISRRVADHVVHPLHLEHGSNYKATIQHPFNQLLRLYQLNQHLEPTIEHLTNHEPTTSVSQLLPASSEQLKHGGTPTATRQPVTARPSKTAIPRRRRRVTAQPDAWSTRLGVAGR